MFPIPPDQVPTWDVKQQVFEITEVFNIDKGTMTDSGAATKRRSGGELGVYDVLIDSAFFVGDAAGRRG
jgi:hypothetical protein